MMCSGGVHVCVLWGFVTHGFWAKCANVLRPRTECTTLVLASRVRWCRWGTPVRLSVNIDYRTRFASCIFLHNVNRALVGGLIRHWCSKKMLPQMKQLVTVVILTMVDLCFTTAPETLRHWCSYDGLSPRAIKTMSMVIAIAALVTPPLGVLWLIVGCQIRWF